MMSYRQHLSLFVLIATILLAIISCKPGYNKIKYADVVLPSTAIKPSALSAHQQKINDIASQIAADPSVDDNAVGIAGVETDQYRRFKWLSEFATNQELISLTNHESANVKAYAFWILCERNNADCKAILDQHVNDLGRFQYMSGCMGWPRYINVFYLQCLSGKLCSKEIEDYKKKIAVNFDEKEWTNVENLDLFNPVRSTAYTISGMPSCR